MCKVNWDKIVDLYIYQKRYIDELIQDSLNSVGAIYIKEPKFVGKTTTCKQFAKSILELGNEEVLDQSLFIAQTQISLLLNGDKPRLIDEWQTILRIWNSIR